MIAIFLIWFWIERQFTVKSVNVILRVTYFIFKTLYISTLSFCFLYYGRYLSLVTNYYGWFIFDFLTQVTRSSFSYFECNCANSAFVDESAISSFKINRIIKSCVLWYFISIGISNRFLLLQYKNYIMLLGNLNHFYSFHFLHMHEYLLIKRQKNWYN